MTSKPAPTIVEEAYTMLLQLGGKHFLLVTGSRNACAAARDERNPCPWLRLDLVPNKANVNRMKISLMPDDTYQVEFYHQCLVDYKVEITNKLVHEMVYAEDLQPLFTSVTGLYTHL